MLNKYCTLILGTMLGVSTLAFSAGGASAAAMIPLSPAASGDVNALNDGIIQIKAGDWRWNRNRHGNRCSSRFDRCRHSRRGHDFGRHSRRGHDFDGLFLSLPLIIGGGYGANHYYNNNYYDDDFSYYGGGNGHVAWCLNRYRSYNPRHNTWISYSGRVRQCHSPYSRY
jgi:hypothetical protein